MKDINIKFIPHALMRDKHQVGDYLETAINIEIRVSDMGNDNYNLACAIHEIWEKHRNAFYGTTDAEINAFDLEHQDHEDPGMLLDSPYHKQHCEADVLERNAIVMSGEDWAEYDKTVQEITK
jgi:hypothetical protein